MTTKFDPSSWSKSSWDEPDEDSACDEGISELEADEDSVSVVPSTVSSSISRTSGSKCSSMLSEKLQAVVDKIKNKSLQTPLSTLHTWRSDLPLRMEIPKFVVYLHYSLR